MGGAANLDFSNINGEEWPLIGYLYADATYKAQYDAYLQEVIDGAFETTKMQNLYDTYANLIEPYATTERAGYSFINSSSEFTEAVSALKTHASERAAAVERYLAQQ
ncbi:CotH protein [compost metagenome]